ncbi:MAG: PIG-L deacetylase family protein [Bacteriovoracia bacterium]
MEFTQVLNSLSSLFKPSSLTKKTSYPFTVMILSPHPDDESITSSLALRLMHENNFHVVNVAVTLGSNTARQEERKKELEEACELLEFENVFLHENWKTKEKELKSLIQKYQPQLIIAPHVKDFHPTHVKTGELLKKVLPSFKKVNFLVAWSEFWNPLSKPNILVEVQQEILELQFNALVKHAGEVKRNPFHLRLPAWMMDNVRRGSEIVAGTGAEATSMAFGVLYQLQLFKNAKLSTIKLQKNFLTSEEDIGQMFKLILDAASGSRTKVK